MIGRMVRGILSWIAQGIGYLLLCLIFGVAWLSGTVALAVTLWGSLTPLPALLCTGIGSLCWGWLLRAAIRLVFPWWNPDFLVDEDDF